MEKPICRAFQGHKVHYYNKEIQNKLLKILSKLIRDKILLSLQKSKYYMKAKQNR